MASISCRKQNLIFARQLSAPGRPPQNRCFNISELALLWSAWSLPNGCPTLRHARGVVDPVCHTWGHRGVPTTQGWDSKLTAHPTPYTLLPTSRGSGRDSSKEAMACSSTSTSPNCAGVRPWRVPWRTSTSHSASWGAFQLRMLERTEISQVRYRWTCWLWAVKSHKLCEQFSFLPPTNIVLC